MIKPKEGKSIIFNVWAMFGGPPPPPLEDFTGTIEKVHRDKNGRLDHYEVKRNHDGYTQNVYRHNLVGYAEQPQVHQ